MIFGQELGYKGTVETRYDEQVEIIRLLVKTLGWSWDRARRAVEKGIADKVLEALRELKGKS